MACFHPIRAWRSALGVVVLREPSQASESGYEYLRLPCGSCLGCRKARALEWAHRCWLESQAHEEQCWTTLTYDEDSVPSGLVKDHLSAWLKRLRSRVAPRTVRFFASGEYGERTDRPHYHAILFGLPRAEKAIAESWPHGFVRVDPLSPAAIAYVAGYAAKKIGWHSTYEPMWGEYERLDRETGEITAGRYKNWLKQPPFILMSRRPGIGAHAKKHWASWRRTAVYHGRQIPVPRFLHQAYLENASPESIQQLTQEKQRDSLLRDTSLARLQAAENIAASLQSIQAQKRIL